MTAGLQTVDRLRAAIKSVVRAQVPREAYLAQYTCRVVGVNPGPPVKIACVPATAGAVAVLPAGMVDIVLWPGPSGGYAIPIVGSKARLAFADGDPSSPYIAALDPSSFPARIGLGGPVTVPMALGVPITVLNTAIGVWAAAVAAALQTLGQPISGPTGVLGTAIGVANAATPAKVVNGL